jgi:hypothetical protein
VATTKDVMRLVEEKGYVNILALVEAFDVDEVRACRILLHLFKQGLLAPMDRSYFARPAEGGLPPKFVSKSTSQGGEGWYAKYLERMRELPVDIGYTATDVEHLLTVSNKVAKGTLLRMQQFDGWVKRQASAGGYINRPFIWGATEEAVDRRDAKFRAVEEDRKERKARKSRPKLTNSQREYDRLMSVRETRQLTSEELRQVVRLRKALDKDTPSKSP